MITSYLGACNECGASLDTAKPALTCSERCRSRRSRRLRRESRRTASEAAFAALLAHGAEIRAALGEGRDPDRQLLDALAAEMDAAADLLTEHGSACRRA